LEYLFGQGLFINQRMADLRKPNANAIGSSRKKTTSDRVLYDASVAYFNWKKT
jgi:hypothetical protein